MKERLFLGGPAHGMWLKVADSIDKVLVPYDKRLNCTRFPGPEIPSNGDSFEEYVRVSIEGFPPLFLSWREPRYHSPHSLNHLLWRVLCELGQPRPQGIKVAG